MSVKMLMEISGDEPFITRVVETAKLAAVYSINRINSTHALIEYNPELTDPDIIRKTLEHYKKDVSTSDLSKLTPTEHEVLIYLVNAYHSFITLPVQHPMHRQEFVHLLHQLQRLVMSRPTARVEGWLKITEDVVGSHVPPVNQNPIQVEKSS